MKEDVIDLQRARLLRGAMMDGIVGLLDLDSARRPMWVGDPRWRELAECVARFPDALEDATLAIMIDDTIFRVRRGPERCVVMVFPRGHGVVRNVVRLLRELTGSRDRARSYEPEPAHDPLPLPPELGRRFEAAFPGSTPADEGVLALAGPGAGAWGTDALWERAITMTLDLHRRTPARRVTLNVENHRVLSMRFGDEHAAIGFSLALTDNETMTEALPRLLNDQGQS